MLNAIKEEIKKQKSYLEAAEVIFEDGSGKNLDDMIILGESAPMMEEGEEDFSMDDDTSPVQTEDADDAESGKPAETEEPETGNSDISDEPIEGPAAPEPIKSDDIGDEPIEDPVEEDPTPAADPDDIGNMPIDDDEDETPMPTPGNDLPEPIGRQTGDPVQDDNIADVNIDLQSNTIRDVLPVPPANAAEAIDGDTMASHVDSGFGDNEPAFVDADDLTSNPSVPVAPEPSEDVPTPSPVGAGDVPKNETEPLSEAITIGDPADDQQPITAAGATGDAADGDIPADAEQVDTATTDASDEGENAVTSAVRDKVAEADTDVGDDGTVAGKDDILVKLGNITKNIEDAKKAVMSAIQ